MDYTEEQIKDKYEALPEDVRAAMESTDVDSKIAELAKKYHLHIDKAEELSDETGLVMLGLTHPKDYLGNLKKRLEISDETARKLVLDVNEQIFKPIRESLKKIHNLEKEGGFGSSGETNFAVESRVNLSRADEKILAESGIEISKPTDNEQQAMDDDIVTQEKAPEKTEIISTLENPSAAAKETVSMPAGFSTKRNIPDIAIGESVLSDDKLASVSKTQTSESVYVEDKTKETPPAPKPKQVDPYREPIN